MTNNGKVLQKFGDVTEIVKGISRSQGMWRNSQRIIQKTSDVTKIREQFDRNQGMWQQKELNNNVKKVGDNTEIIEEFYRNSEKQSDCFQKINGKVPQKLGEGLSQPE